MLKYALPLLVVFLSACVSSGGNAHVTLGNATVVVEIADSDEERSLGLMNRESLAKNAGLLFVFPDEAKRSFWMKNTKMPLDIIFISSDLIIVDMQTMKPCEAEPCRTYPSRGAAKYALEVNRGFAEANALQIGDRVTIRWPL